MNRSGAERREVYDVGDDEETLLAASDFILARIATEGRAKGDPAHISSS